MDRKPQISVGAPDGITVVEPAVWVPSLREMSWRVDIDERGAYTLDISLGGETVTKLVDASAAVVRRSPVRVRGFLDELIYPAEPALPAASPFESIEIDYDDATVNVFGLGIHWLIVFFVLSIVFAFALRNRMGVKI